MEQKSSNTGVVGFELQTCWLTLEHATTLRLCTPQNFLKHGLLSQILPYVLCNAWLEGLQLPPEPNSATGAESIFTVALYYQRSTYIRIHMYTSHAANIVFVF